MAHLIGSLAGVVALSLGGLWLARAQNAGREPLSILLPLTGGVVGILAVVLGSSAADRNFGIDQPLLLVLVSAIPAVLGFIAGMPLSRGYYQRERLSNRDP
jgi:hypothetical protein